MDKIFKKSFFNDSSRRSAQQEKAAPLLPPAGFYAISNNDTTSKHNKTVSENAKEQPRNYFPPENDPSKVGGKTPASHKKAQPTIATGKRQQQQQQRPRQQSLSSPYQQTQQQQPPLQQSQSTHYHPNQNQQQHRRKNSAENSNSTLGSNRNSIASSDFSLDDKQPPNQQQRPPVPKHHPDPSQIDLTGLNANDNGNKEKAGKKREILAGQVKTLTEAKTKLEQQLMGLQMEKDQQCVDLQRQCEELQRSLKFKEDEYTKMQNNFHKHVRAIRATDDDLSTIHAKLTMLQAKASQLPMALRGFYQEARSTEVMAYFYKRWPSLKDTLDQLLLHDPLTGTLITTTSGTKKQGSKTKATAHQSKLDYPLVCLLVEKIVMEVLVEHAFRSPVHLGLPVNDNYQALSDFMEHHQAKDWSNKLRQQLCKIAANADQEKVGITRAKEYVVQCLKKEIDIIYKVPSEKVLPKLVKLVDLAAETSLAMHGQDEPVLFGTDLVEGRSMFDPLLMSLQFGSAMVAPSPSPKSNDSSELHRSNDIAANDTTYNDEENDEDNSLVLPASPLPSPSLVVRVLVSPVVYAGDENGQTSPLLLGRVICF